MLMSIFCQNVEDLLTSVLADEGKNHIQLAHLNEFD